MSEDSKIPRPDRFRSRLTSITASTASVSDRRKGVPPATSGCVAPLPGNSVGSISIPTNRIAIYLGRNEPPSTRADILRQFKEAKAFGLRVVTVSHELRGAAAGRPILATLIDRMNAGEFDAIMGVDDESSPGSALPLPSGQAAWLPYRGRARP